MRLLSHTIFLTYGLMFASSAFAQSPKICAIYPHLKDAYWLSVHYGMTQYAQKHGVNLKILEANGYQAETAAQTQWQTCLNWQSDAILLGMPIEAPQTHIPTFTFVNTPTIEGAAPHVGSDWQAMGRKLGQYLSDQHPQNTASVYASLLLGPKDLPTSHAFYQGLKQGLTNSSVTILTQDWGDTDKEVQRNLWLKQQAQYGEKLDYVIANAVTAEVVANHQTQHPNLKPVRILSTYLTHGVYRGLKRGKIAYAIDDQPAKQGEVAIQNAIQWLSNAPLSQNVTFRLHGITPKTLPKLSQLQLAPLESAPHYRIENVTKKR